VFLRGRQLEVPGESTGAGDAKKESPGSRSEFPSVTELQMEAIKLEEETARKPAPGTPAPHGTARRTSAGTGAAGQEPGATASPRLAHQLGRHTAEGRCLSFPGHARGQP